MEKASKKAVVLLFFLVLFGFSAAHFCLPDTEISVSERRYLDAAPTLRADKVFSGRYFQELESYLLDQFPLREELRTLKAVTELYLLDMGETGGVVLAEGHLLPDEEPFRADEARIAIDRMNAILETHLDGEAYLAIVPDKGYYLWPDTSRTVTDFVRGNTEARYIDLTGLLSLSDYYTTDSHWRQERLLPVAQHLCRSLGVPVIPETAYTQYEAGSFFGVYAGQSALPCEPDTLRYLVSRGTQEALVTSVETGEIPVYAPEAIENVDPYDVYLGGPQAVITLENPNAATDRHLIMFRDSFGSSIAPLLADSYGKITLVDLRYVRSELLAQYVDFEDADILFLYSTSVLNNGSILK